MPLRQADASKLTINEYLYGMCLVMSHLVDTNGDWKSYLSHFKRVMKFFIGKKYVNAAYVAYDKEVVDSYLKTHQLGSTQLTLLLSRPISVRPTNMKHRTIKTRMKGGTDRTGIEAGKPLKRNPMIGQRRHVICITHPRAMAHVGNNMFVASVCYVVTNR